MFVEFDTKLNLVSIASDPTGMQMRCRKHHVEIDDIDEHSGEASGETLESARWAMLDEYKRAVTGSDSTDSLTPTLSTLE